VCVVLAVLRAIDVLKKSERAQKNQSPRRIKKAVTIGCATDLSKLRNSLGMVIVQQEPGHAGEWLLHAVLASPLILPTKGSRAKWGLQIHNFND
jgi:hypothetical protein